MKQSQNASSMNGNHKLTQCIPILYVISKIPILSQNWRKPEEKINTIQIQLPNKEISCKSKDHIQQENIWKD